ncbi:MAG: hypothetical protein ACXVX7_00050 [Mycobacterium sp.]
MADTTEELIDRRTLLEKLKISDSSERRRRARQRGWPAHLRIGSKIFYRNSVVDEWVRQQEAISLKAFQTRGEAESDTMTAILRRAKVLADAAPPADTSTN